MKKRTTDYNPNFFWIVTVQDRCKTSPSNDSRPLGTINYLNVIDTDKILGKNQKQLLSFSF